MSPKAGAHGEMCGMMAIKAAIAAAARPRRERSCWRRNWRMAPIPPPPPRSAFRCAPSRRAATAWSIPSGRRRARPRRRRDHADQSQHLRPVRARHCRNREAGPRGRGLFLLRRRQFQRHRRQGAAGRSRRRRHAYQSAQDFFDAAWRRRPGRRAGGLVAARLAPLSRRCPLSPRRRGLHLVEHGTKGTQTFGRMRPSMARWECSCARCAYILSHGATVSAKASEDAVLAANYLRVCLSDLMSSPFPDKLCMHEDLFDDTWLKEPA